MAGLLEIFQKNLNDKMNSRGENIADLSRSLGIAFSTVSDWVNGKKMPRAGNIEALSEHYNVNNDYFTTIHNTNSKYKRQESHDYNFFDAGLSAGVLTAIDPFTSEDVKKITLSDFIMGKYAGDQEIFLTYINGESMNRIMPNHSLIAIKKYDSVVDLKDGDIVAFDDAGEMCVKQFYKDYRSRTYSFSPNSTDSAFTPIIYRWEDAQEITIIGKIVTYVVNV